MTASPGSAARRKQRGTAPLSPVLPVVYWRQQRSPLSSPVLRCWTAACWYQVVVTPRCWHHTIGPVNTGPVDAASLTFVNSAVRF